MMKTFLGRVHGRSIHVQEDIGIADGEEVEVVISPVRRSTAWGEGIRRSAGAAAEILEFDQVFAQVEKERKTAQFRETTE